MEINKRNTETAEQAFKDLYTKIYAQREMIDNLHNTIATLQNRMSALEQQLIVQKVQLCGLGPSERS